MHGSRPDNLCNAPCLPHRLQRLNRERRGGLRNIGSIAESGKLGGDRIKF
jgi:hypothetical protein